MPLSQLGVPPPSRPIHIMFVFLLSHSFASSTWRSWLNFFEFVFVFFRSKKLSQLDAIELERCVSDVFELARCCWGSSFHLSEPANFSQCEFNCQAQSQMTPLIEMVPPVAAQKFRSHVLGQICLDSRATLKSNTWPVLKLSQLHVLS